MKNIGRSLALPVAAALGLLAAAGCHQAATSAPLRIGVIAMLSGESAHDGRSLEAAAGLAVRRQNASGGLRVGKERRPVEIVVEDDGGGPEAALEAARRLIARGDIHYLIGPQFSSHAIPVARLAEREQVLMICPLSTNPQTTSGKGFVFRIPYLDTFQGAVLARFARENLRAGTAAVLFDVAGTYNRTLAGVFRRDFEAAGGRVTGFETYTSDRNQDFGAQLARIAADAPALLLLPNYSADVLLQARQARAMGIRSVLLGGDGWDPERFEQVDELQGSFCTRHWHVELATPRSWSFVEAYRQEMRRLPQDVAATTFDAFSLLFEAVEKAGHTEPRAVRDALVALPPYEGITGSIDYVGDGDPRKSAVIVQILDRRSTVHAVMEPR